MSIFVSYRKLRESFKAGKKQKAKTLVSFLKQFFIIHWCDWVSNTELKTYIPAVIVACENIRFSSLFAAGDVSRGGTSATQRQKFHTDDVKSARNPVRSADW